jgi:hypothetical protein
MQLGHCSSVFPQGVLALLVGVLTCPPPLPFQRGLQYTKELSFGTIKVSNVNNTVAASMSCIAVPQLFQHRCMDRYLLTRMLQRVDYSCSIAVRRSTNSPKAWDTSHRCACGFQ